MLACARIGAPHNVVFGGFSAEAVRERMEFSRGEGADHRRRRRAQGQDGAGQGPRRRGHGRPRHAARRSSSCAARARRARCSEGRDVYYDEIVAAADPECPAEPLDAEHPLFILYTSGSTAKPKGILHTTGGYLTGVSATHRYVFDLQPESDVYWCAADVGWVTGHSYIVYGPLANGATSVMWEGAPDYPAQGHLVGDRRALRRDDPLLRADRDPRVHQVGRASGRANTTSRSLRLLGSVGEPINPKAWLWYHKVIGGERCPIVDTWWQTETGAIMITPLPGHHRDQAGLGDAPVPGRVRGGARRVDGEPIEEGQGLLVLTQPVAVDAAHPLQGGGALRRDLLQALRQGDLPGRRRRPARRRRLLLGDRADRRRRQRLRPPALDGRGRVGDRRPRRRRRGGRDRPARRGHRPGDRRVRDAAGRARGRRGARSRASARPSPSGSASSPARSGSSGPTTCPRRARARSCAGCCATSPRAARWAT